MIAGVDLALRRSAVAVAPVDYSGDMRLVEVLVIEGDDLDLESAATEEERADRTRDVARRILEFAKRKGVTRVWFEQYAFNRPNQAQRIGEVTGVVKAVLRGAGIGISAAPATQARALLCGKIPSNHPSAREKRRAAGGPDKVDAKKLVQKVLRAAGAPESWKADECDAVVMMNLGVSEAGGVALASPR